MNQHEWLIQMKVETLIAKRFDQCSTEEEEKKKWKNDKEFFSRLPK